MQTRKALAKLTSGEAEGEHVDSPLAKNASKFLGQYELTEQAISDRKADLNVPLPFVNAIKKKIKAETADDMNLPVVASFDLYSGISKLARRSVSDSGLKRLSGHLERIWNNDPLGSLTYGQVSSLVRMYKDQFPRSAASDAIEAECAKVGMHKLPVAKLSRIASKVDSQETYEQLIEANGLDGNRAEHVKSRAFIRGLVAMQSGIDVGTEDGVTEFSPAQELIANKLASFDKDAGYTEALSALEKAVSLGQQLQKLVDSAAAGMHEDNITSSGGKLDALGKELDNWVGQFTDAWFDAQPLPDAPPAAEPDQSQKAPSQKTLKVPGVDIGKIKRKISPTKNAPTQYVPGVDNRKTQEVPGIDLGKVKPKPKTPEEEAGLTKKWYDPRTWSYAKTSTLISAAREASLELDGGPLDEAISDFISRMAQLAPLMEDDTLPPDQQDPLDALLPPADEEMPGDPMQDEEMQMQMDVEPDDVSTGVDMVQEIQDVAEDIIEEAPPEAVDFVQHEMDEGHEGVPGTALWGAEEMTNKGEGPTGQGHTEKPPSEGWIREELMELGARKAQRRGPLKHDEFREQVRDQNNPDRPLWIEDTGAGEPLLGDDGLQEHDIEPYLGDDEFGSGSMEDLHDLEMGAPDLPFEEDDVNQTLEELMEAEGLLEKAGARGKGIPLPKEKVKSQPKVTTYAKKPSSGSQALKASVVEDALLSGHTVKVGSVSISINDNDEVELWNKTSGVACSLEHLDTAIADFIKFAHREVSAVDARVKSNSFTYTASEVVAVPCEECSGMGVFPRAASTSGYRCECGHVISAASVEELMRVTAQHRAYQITIKYPMSQTPEDNKLRRARIVHELEKISARIDDESRGTIVSTVWNTDEHAMDKLTKKLQMLGGMLESEAKRWAKNRSGQMAAPAPQAPAAPAPIDVSAAANASFANSKLRGLDIVKAMQEFLSEYQERLKEVDLVNSPDVLDAMNMHYSSGVVEQVPPGAPAAPAAIPSPPPQGGISMGAAAKEAQSRMKVPSIRKPKDHVSAPSSPGKDTEGAHNLPSPGKIKTNHKPTNKMSPKELGKDSETMDLGPSPAESPRPHIDSPSGSKFSDKDLGEDSELNDNMPVPSPGAKPSVDKKKLARAQQ